MSNYKIITHISIGDADKVRKAVGDTGAGIQGNYSHCSFTIRGTGRFLPIGDASPSIGKVGHLEEVEEDLIEFICEKALVTEVITAIKTAHPYEEVPIEVYKLETF